MGAIAILIPPHQIEVKSRPRLLSQAAIKNKNKEEDEKEEATTSRKELLLLKEISFKVALASVLPELYGIFTFKEEH